MTQMQLGRLENALAAGARAFLAALDDEGGLTAFAPTPEGPITFNPLTDPLPRNADPAGSQEERWMCSLAYLGAIAVINKTENRGADAKDVSKYAKKAGYINGRVVNAWGNKGGALENRNGERWINAAGYKLLHQVMDDLGIIIEGI